MGYDLLIAFGWISAMLVAASILRAKIKVLQKTLIPSCVLGGILGYILVNTNIIKVDYGLLSVIVFQLFIISFISVGLTGSSDNGNSEPKDKTKELLKGATWMAIIWVALSFIQMIIGIVVIMLTNKFGNTMDPFYGVLLPYGFASGPGQAVTYGNIIEGFGYENAVMVGMTFAAIGFIWAFLVGIPVAKVAIRKGLAKHAGELTDEVLKGIYPSDKQKHSTGKMTFHGANMDTLAFHFALIGVVYLVAYYLTNWIAPFFPPNWEKIIIGLLYIWGMLVAMLAKYIMGKFKAMHAHDNETQKRITGWAVDYFVLATLMSIQFAVIKQWIVPILISTTLAGIVTAIVCYYFGRRIGGSNDFERTISLYGLSTGTVPTGLALLRIVDPDFKTNTAKELGLMNPFCLFATALVVVKLAPFTLGWSISMTCLVSAGIAVALLLSLKILRLWGAKSY